MISHVLLNDAAQALEDLASGKTPDIAKILSGVTGIDALQLESSLDRNEILAAQVLLRDALCGQLNLEEDRRTRAAQLARRMREIGTAH